MSGNRPVSTAMGFAVALTSVDRTIVAIATPSLQREPALGQTASQ